MIVLFGGEKGGTGKTTLAVNIAAMRRAADREVLLVDADPQGSAALWCALRDDLLPDKRIPCARLSGPRIHKDIAEMAARYEDVVIDAGGRDSQELRAALLAAERFFTPLRPSQFDVWSLERMGELVAGAQKINAALTAWVVLNQASANPRIAEAEEAREFLGGLARFALAATVLRDRILYRRAIREGLAVHELPEKGSKAAREMRSLYSEVFRDETPHV